MDSHSRFPGQGTSFIHSRSLHSGTPFQIRFLLIAKGDSQYDLCALRLCCSGSFTCQSLMTFWAFTCTFFFISLISLALDLSCCLVTGQGRLSCFLLFFFERVFHCFLSMVIALSLFRSSGGSNLSVYSQRHDRSLLITSRSVVIGFP